MSIKERLSVEFLETKRPQIKSTICGLA